MRVIRERACEAETVALSVSAVLTMNQHCSHPVWCCHRLQLAAHSPQPWAGQRTKKEAPA